jgi:RNA polymerase sigma factor (sigma-70 family)
MNINELDSYNLGDAVKFNDRLNPRIWGADEKMRPEVREQLLKIADDFREFLGIDVEVKDITVSGSNAAYTYTPHSDIDLHLVVDLPMADASEVYRELFDAKKYAYNDQHDIRIGGHEVELYVQDANKQHVSQGIYSITNDDWVSVPKRRRPDVDDISLKSKFEDLGHRIESVVAGGDYEQITALAQRIKELRQAGLDAHGEFGPENLAFKMLRTQGLIKKLYDARNAAKDQLLSLDERKKKRKKKIKYGYGGYWYPGYAYAGQDHPAGSEGGDSGGGDGGGESVREDAGMTWDGVNPTTDMFTSEDATMTWDGVNPSTAMFTTETEDTTDEEILRDFIEFCVKELKIEHMPRVKLRKDPQWPAVHRTFGRYNDETKTLEVAWGQRHIMDVLRTVAHELTHKHQHEREGQRMGADAGETGSPYENEANARAGVLMRDYGRLHPEYFTVGQAHDLEEANPNQQLSLYNPDGTTYRQEKMPVPDPDDFHSETNPRKRIDQLTHQDLYNRTATDLVDPIERAEQNIDKERLKDAIRASMSSLTSNETAVLNMRFWKDLTLAQTAKALNMSAGRIRQIEAKALRKLRHESRSDRLEPFVKEGASGYIPTKAQAKDPRYSMALTVDIKPGQVGKEANKLKLKTDKQGHPQIAQANGLFENLMSEYKKYKADEDLTEDQQLDEVAMSPGALAKWAQSDAAQGIRAGFEAELIFRDTTNDDDDDGEMEPDYDYDERARSVSQVIDFFNGGDYGGLSDRQEGRLQDGLDQQYMEWQDERMRDAFDEEAEDLIRKVLVDEGDWDEDNEIQKQLALLDLSNDEMNAIINAGERAPRFTKSSEQQAYIKENPLYQKYLDAQTEAEGLLDDLIADEVRKKGANWDAALDEFRENFYVDDDSDFFSDVGLSYMSDIASEYSLDWPYLTGGGGGNNGGSRDWEDIGNSLNSAVDMPVKVSSNYHSTTRKEGQWIVEPDTSLSPDDREDFGLEIVSPPLPLLTALEKLQEVTDWANNPRDGNAYTNQSTGLHMGVSVPYKGGDVDYVKLILFLGDEYVLQSFGREANSYTKSAMSKFRENIRGGRADPAGALALMQSNLIEFAYREIQKGVGTGKYTSAHIQDGYIEFRSAGGDWLAEESADPQKLSSTMLRYARAMQIAANPAEERQEYAKKLYKLIAPEGDSQLSLFSQFAAGAIDKDQLKKQWAERTIGTERKMNQRWKLYDRATGEPVPGQEYNGYTEEEARARAKGKISPGSSDRDFDSAYELRNMSGDQQWEIYSVDTGETLEIVQAKNRGLAADAVFDKYANQGVGFNVRAYQDPATMTPRAKLAKRITGQPGKPVDYNYEIVNQADVRLPVVDKFYATNDTDAQKVYSQWLKSKDLPDDTADYGYRKTAAKSAEEPPWVAQNFDSARDSATLQTNLQGRAGQDATEVRRNWEFVNRMSGNVVDTLNNASYNRANAVQADVERRHPNADIYLRSVERPN